MVAFQVLTLEQIWDDCLKLAKKIDESKFSPDILICISRGGLVVGRFLSDMLRLSMLRVIGVEFYKGINTRAKQPRITQDLIENVAKKRVLVIDDVADTGASLAFIKEYLLRKKPAALKTATLHYKPKSAIKPDFYVLETTDWLVYPWEYFEFSYTYVQEELERGKTLQEILANLEENLLPNKVLEKVKEEMENSN
ncbi:MAG: phosphoribosyltransferase [Candidatus Heimdallarchaeota archaeon]